MISELFSLTDELKKNLYFFENMTVAELTPYIHQKMLKDYSLAQVEERIGLCLQQHPCFYLVSENVWCLNTEGLRCNDDFYTLLLKHGQPLSIKEIFNNKFNGKNKNKKIRRLMSEEANLISDGRFIQLDNDYWGFTQWVVETANYSVKHLIIKALKKHPAGLNSPQIFEFTCSWRKTSLPAVKEVLHKYPYFELKNQELWIYEPAIRLAYERLIGRYLLVLKRQRERRNKERECWRNKLIVLKKQLREVNIVHQETAVALAQRTEDNYRQEYLVTQMAEKDLLLSLRKKEIFRYREHINKLEAKANSILYQCKLWVERTRAGENEKTELRKALKDSLGNIALLATKIQEKEDNERKNNIAMINLKEHYTTRIAELQNEIVELRQKLERSQEKAVQQERQYQSEIDFLNNSLKEALEKEQEQQRSLLLLQKELTFFKKENQKHKALLKNPLVKLILMIFSFFQRYLKQTA
ncbi:MAG: hypothetical protein STSR0004_05920 [Peptococcaceae bacterium]